MTDGDHLVIMTSFVGSMKVCAAHRRSLRREITPFCPSVYPSHRAKILSFPLRVLLLNPCVCPTQTSEGRAPSGRNPVERDLTLLVLHDAGKGREIASVLRDHLNSQPRPDGDGRAAVVDAGALVLRAEGVHQRLDLQQDHRPRCNARSSTVCPAPWTT